MNNTISKVMSYARNLDPRQHYNKGCIDAIVVDQPNGTLKSTRFQVCFGKLGGTNAQVAIYINDQPSSVTMRLDKDGRGYFESDNLGGYQSDDTTLESISQASSAHYQLYRDFESTLVENPKQQPWFLSSITRLFKTNRTEGKSENDSSTKYELTKQESKIEQEPDQKQEQKSEQKGDTKHQQGRVDAYQTPFNESETLSSPRNQMVQISLCGFSQLRDPQKNHLVFEKHRIGYQAFLKDYSSIIQNKNLTFKVGEKYYSREEGLAILIAEKVFQQEMEPAKKGTSLLQRFLGRKEAQDPVTSNNSSRSQSKSSERVRRLSEETSTLIEQGKRRGRKPKLPSRPSNEILQKFGLRYGENKITYKVIGDKEKSEMSAWIFYYNQDTKLVISDIDGTITKTDILGQVMPKLNMAWSHEGIVQLYQSIWARGYKILYLTARAIGQVGQTKDFIYSLSQENSQLPLGPIVTSPDDHFTALKREVLDQTPEQFKIQALKEIRSLFLTEGTPFYCGFGNKLQDATAYGVLNVDIRRIYIIDPDSRIHVSESEETISYLEMHKNLDLYFPHIQDCEYQDQNFWRLPLPDCDLE